MDSLFISVLDCGSCPPLDLGYAGENEVTQVVLDFSPWAAEFGDGAVTLELMRSGDTAPHAGLLTIEGTTAIWTVTDVDTARSGPGVAGFIYRVNGKVKKSAVYKTAVKRDLRESGELPDPWDALLEQLEELLGEMQQEAADTRNNAAAAGQSAEAAAESETHAQEYSQGAGQSAEAADQSKRAAETSEGNAEAWAVGERGGTPVPASDPAYQNNARHWADLAQQGAKESGFAFFDVHEEDGAMYVTVTDNLARSTVFAVNENSGELEVTVNA